MGLFDAKPSQASNVLPEVADCDRQLTALNQRREELIYWCWTALSAINAAGSWNLCLYPLRTIPGSAQNAEPLMRREPYSAWAAEINWNKV